MPTGIDARSEKNIKTLVPGAQEWARAFLQRVLAAGINAQIISGTRTYEEQNELYAIGRTKPGHIVTKARGGYSNHNFGIAWDIGIFDGNKYVEESPLYDKAGQIGRAMGLEWGGDWKNIVDKPHFECKTGKSLAELRQLVAQGSPIPVQPFHGQPVVFQPASMIQITVFVDGAACKIPAMCIEDRTWVGVKAFVAALGGNLVSAGGNPFRVSVALNESSQEFEGQIIEGTGFVKFADLNAIYKLGFTFDGPKKTLLITK